MEDGSSTYISPPGASSSTIDLTFVTRDLATLCEVVTGTDSHGSDHFPVHITINDTLSTSKRFKCKIKLNKGQLGVLHCLLERESNRIEEIFSSSVPLDPITKYRTSILYLLRQLNQLYRIRFPDQVRVSGVVRSQLPGGTVNIRMQLVFDVIFAECIKLILPWTIGLSIDVKWLDVGGCSKGRRD